MEKGIIRAVRSTDAETMRAIYAPHIEHSAVSFEVVVPSPMEWAARVEEYQAFAPWLVYEVDKQVVGYAYASKHRAREAYRWAVEVSAYVDPRWQRRGISRALYSELFTLLRNRGYHVALAGITLPNEASIAMHEAMGFVLIGVYREIGFKLGKWYDVGWWQKVLQPAGQVPKEILK